MENMLSIILNLPNFLFEAIMIVLSYIDFKFKYKANSNINARYYPCFFALSLKFKANRNILFQVGKVSFCYRVTVSFHFYIADEYF